MIMTSLLLLSLCTNNQLANCYSDKEYYEILKLNLNVTSTLYNGAYIHVKFNDNMTEDLFLC